MRRFWHFIRSPRTAVALIIALGAYCGLVTAVPQQDLDAARLGAWVAAGGVLPRIALALGLDNAFSTPLFFILVIGLSLSTVACSMVRTTAARRFWRERGQVTEGIKRRLDRSPDIELELDLGVDTAPAEIGRRLRSVGLKGRVGARAGYAEAGAIGLFGSPAFHWALAAMIVCIALGQTVRWEGLVGVPEGRVTLDEPTSYGRMNDGPAPAPHTGWGMRLVSVEEHNVVDGVEYGWVPTIALVDGERELVRQRVHTNKPLRYGPLLIHYSNHGLSTDLEVVDASGTVVGKKTLIFDFDDASASGTTSMSVDVTSGQGDASPVSLTVLARDTDGKLPRVMPPMPSAEFTIGSASSSQTVSVAGVGASVSLPDGGSLRLADIGSYARLNVVRDWSVGWLYVLMGIATLALTIAVLIPYRAVWFVVRPSDTGVHVSAVVRHAQRNRVFERAVAGALEGVENSDDHHS